MSKSKEKSDFKKILIITYYWPPAGGPGVQRWLKMSKYLPEFGIDPVILTVDHQNASYPIIDESLLLEIPNDLEVFRTKSFEPLQAYSKLFGQQKVPYSGFSNVETTSLFSKLTRWVRGNFFIPDARIGWNKFAKAEAEKIIELHNIETVITTGPPHSTHLIGEYIKSKRNISWIADFRDPWTDIYYYNQLKHTAWAAKKDRRLEQTVLENADLVLSVCDSNANTFQAKLPQNPEKIKVVTNGFDRKDFLSQISKKGQNFVISYTGTLAESYSPYSFLEVLSKLDIDFTFQVAGKISPEIEKYIQDIGLSQRTNYLGYIEHARAVEVLRMSDLLLHVLPTHDGSSQGTTGKIFEYLGAAVPIINIGSKTGDTAIYMSKVNAGCTFERDEQLEMEAFVMKVYNSEFEVSGNVDVFSRESIAKSVSELIHGLK